ncbi:hypothetical protein ONZ45_g17077 [Pleurotus djamor]|nr:hypothetical protein ONZ45_g17077 [Pleurotus djamor]
MISLSTVLCLGSILSGVALGKPTRRQTAAPEICEPKFEPDEPYDWNNSEAVGLSNGLNVDSGLIKTTPPTFFKFQKVGANPPIYTIHTFDKPLAVELSGNSSLVLKQDNGNVGGQKFVIECGFCGSAVQDNCFMRLVDKPNSCVQVGNNAPSRGSSGDALFIASSCRRDDSQRFNYFKRELIDPSEPPYEGGGTALAPPPPGHGGVCNPNFEFEGVRVANSAINWGAPTFESNIDLVGESDFNKRLEIRFEQTGSPVPYYIAKSLNGSNLVVATRAVNDNLYFIPADENNERKFFNIECSSGCSSATAVAPGDLTADGCTIKSTFNQKCVQVGNGPSAGNQGDRIFLNDCNGSDSQRFNFITSPFKQSGREPDYDISTATTAGAPKVHLAGESGGDVNIDLGELIRNSYIVIGLLAGLLISMIALGALMLSKGCLKGREAKPRYTVVAGKDTEGFTAHPSGRYSD